MVTNVTTVSPPPATGARRSAEVAALPKPAHTLISAAAFLAGACLLASAFDPNLSHGTQSLRFWCFMGGSGPCDLSDHGAIPDQGVAKEPSLDGARRARETPR